MPCDDIYLELNETIKVFEMKKDVALALSSGGGAIEELEEQEYRISAVSGCSMGALVGGVYAAGKLKEFREWMKTIDRKKMLELTDFSFSLSHLVKGTRIIEAIMEFVPDMPIEDLPIPFCCVATDWKTGREIVFNKGSLFEAIRASISLPSFYEPVQKDGMILIDGGVVNPIPLNRVKRKAGDILVGIDVSGHDYKKENVNHFNYYTMLSRTSSIMIRQNSILMTKLTKPDMLVDIQMEDVDKHHQIREQRIKRAKKTSECACLSKIICNFASAIAKLGA